MEAADAITLNHIERIVWRPLASGWKKTASYPVGSGGMGFTHISDIDQRALSAAAVESIARVVGIVVEAAKSQELLSEGLIKALDAIQRRALFQEPQALLMNSRPSGLNAKLISDSNSAPYASAFLSANPGPQTTINNVEFRDALWLRFGLPAPVGHSNCDPSPLADPLGLHRVGCRNAAGARTRRHNDMVAVLANTALAADPRAFQVEREERLADAEGSKSRPGDVALNLGNCRTLADLTVASPFLAACQTSARYAGTLADAATLVYDLKLLKWQGLLDSHQLDAGELASMFCCVRRTNDSPFCRFLAR